MYQHLPLKDSPKCTQIGIFSLKMYGLATLTDAPHVFQIISMFEALTSFCPIVVAEDLFLVLFADVSSIDASDAQQEKQGFVAP
jgi:hypothetical protein